MRRVINVITYLLLLCLVAGYLLLPTHKANRYVKKGYTWENYDSALASKINNVDDMLIYTDSVVGKEYRHTLDYTLALSRLTSFCFYHSYSYYSFRDNWIANLAGEVVRSDLHAIVTPDDILKHPNAACSQVAIVLAAALKKIGITYRKVALYGHFVLEAQLNGRWYLFDPNLEPQFPNGRKSIEELVKSNELLAAYNGRKPLEEIKRVFSKIEYGEPNEKLAPNAVLFHKTTFVLSSIIIIALLLIAIIDLSVYIDSRIQHTYRQKDKAKGVGEIMLPVLEKHTLFKGTTKTYTVEE